MPKKNGRPKTHVPMNVVDAACQLNATAKQVLEILASQGHKISHATLVREIKRLHKITFDEYRDKKTDLTRLKLAQKAVKMAFDGNVAVLIFCLKNLCGWRDRNEISGPVGSSGFAISMSYNPATPVVLPTPAITGAVKNDDDARTESEDDQE